MKLPKKIAALLIVTLATSSVANLGYVNAAEGVSSEVLKGTGRWETAIEVSKKGWPSATEAVIVNDASIADALAATPFADAKNAPILLTGKDSLNEKTKAELKRLGVKKVYIIGGVNTLTKKVEALLKSEKLEVDRIYGNTRELTALEIAKRLDEIKSISEIAVVNSTKGLADAVSIAATAADKDMAIILSNTNEGTKASDEFIKSKNIKTSYVIGGEKSISEEVKNKLPNAQRIKGNDRNETNAKVLETFYTEKEINNAYVAKDGMGKVDNLIDALAVGVLAAKNDSPVIIVGNKLNEMQKDITNTKSFKTITQVGGNGNEAAFNELKIMQGVTTYEVKTVAELNDALAKADANDVINVRSLNDNSRSNKIEISSKNKVQINIHATSEKSIVVNVASGSLIAHGSHTSIDVKSGELVIKGTVNTVNIESGGEVAVKNEGTSKPNITVAEAARVEVSGNVNSIAVNGKDANVTINKDCKVSKIEVSKDAGNNDIKIDGKVDSAVTNAPNVNIDNNGTLGGTSGSNKPNVNGNTIKPSLGGGDSGGGTPPGQSNPIKSDEQIVNEEINKYEKTVKISKEVEAGDDVTGIVKKLIHGESANTDVSVAIKNVGSLLELNEGVVTLKEQIEFENTENKTKVELEFKKGNCTKNVDVDVEIEKQDKLEPQSIIISSYPIQTKYIEDDELKLDGVIVKLTYDNNVTKDVNFNEFDKYGLTTSITQGHKLEITDNIVTITHTDTDKSINLDIQVSPKEGHIIVSDEQELNNALGTQSISRIYIDNMIQLTTRFTINREIELIGITEDAGLQAASNFRNNNGKQLVSVNITSNTINTEEEIVKIKNLSFDSNKIAYGIQAINLNPKYKVVLDNINTINSNGSGLTVNGARVTANNLKTSGNYWQGVNVDPSNTYNSEFKLTGENCNLQEAYQIKSDNYDENRVIVDLPNDYKKKEGKEFILWGKVFYYWSNR